MDLEPSTEDFTPAELRARGHRPECHRPHSHHVGLPAGTSTTPISLKIFTTFTEVTTMCHFHRRAEELAWVQGSGFKAWALLSLSGASAQTPAHETSIAEQFPTFLIYSALLSPHLQHQTAPLTQRLQSVATVKYPNSFNALMEGESKHCTEYCLSGLTWRITECEKRNRIKKAKVHQKIPFAHVSLCKNKRKSNKK